MKTQDTEMLLIGVVTILRPGFGLPPSWVPIPPSHLSIIETTEEKKVFSLLHTHFGIYELGLEMIPTYHFNFYVWYQTYLRLANMDSNHLQCWVIRSLHCCHILSINSHCWAYVSLFHTTRGWETSHVFLLRTSEPISCPGIESWKYFLRRLHLDPPCVYCTHGYGSAADGSSHSARHRGSVPSEDMGMNHSELKAFNSRPLERFAVILKERQWSFKFQGSSDFQKSSSKQTALWYFWAHMNVWGWVCVGFWHSAISLGATQ